MIVGFNVNKIDAGKSQNIGGDLQVNYVPKIKDVKPVSVNAFDEEVAKIDYSFAVQYVSNNQPKAEINIEGDVLWNGKTEEVIAAWQENEELLEEIRAPLMNDLYRKLLSEAVGIADTLNMLPPIPTPQVDQN